MKLPSLFPTQRGDPELYPFRHGLVFSFFNAITWQVAIGTPLVLFAERLGGSTLQVGLAYSFVFLLTPIQVVATALIPRFGFKRLTLVGWGVRRYFLLVPIALAALAPKSPPSWMINALVISVFCFCLFRAIGASAIVAWLYGLVPENAQGRYFANDQLLSAVGSVGMLLVSVLLFMWLPAYQALLIQYSISLLGSSWAYRALKRLPDVPSPKTLSLAAVLRDTPRHLFKASPFRYYLWLAVCWYVISTPIPPFAAYYLKVVPHLGSGQIMSFEVLRYTGVMIAAWLIRRRIDLTGARPFFLVALGLCAGLAIYWWVYLRLGETGIAGIYGVYFLLGVGATCWTVANLSYLPKVTPGADRTLMVALHGAVTAWLGGLAPVLWGGFLRASVNGRPSIHVGVFETFFVVVLITAILLSPLVGRLTEDRATPAEPLIIGNAMLRPFRAATYLASLIDLPSLKRTGRPAHNE